MPTGGTSRCRLALQARWLSGAQEVAVVPGTGRSWAGVVAGGGALLCGGGEADWGDSAGDKISRAIVKKVLAAPNNLVPTVNLADSLCVPTDCSSAAIWMNIEESG